MVNAVQMVTVQVGSNMAHKRKNSTVVLVNPKPKNVIQFRNITAAMADTYERKNADYGDSFSESIAEFGPVAGIVRIGDKFNRLKNLIKNPGKQRVHDESIADTLLDMANYCIMLHIEINNKNE